MHTTAFTFRTVSDNKEWLTFFAYSDTIDDRYVRYVAQLIKWCTCVAVWLLLLLMVVSTVYVVRKLIIVEKNCMVRH